MLSLQHLNLQGNKLIGSIPENLNNVKHLNTLALSHNQLIGTIGLDLDHLINMERLYLHNNKLYGTAPEIQNNKAMNDYVTDCGDPRPVNCLSCTICCNDESLCIRNSMNGGQPAVSIFIFFSFVIVLIVVYTMKEKVTSARTRKWRNYLEEEVTIWRASDLIGDKVSFIKQEYVDTCNTSLLKRHSVKVFSRVY